MIKLEINKEKGVKVLEKGGYEVHKNGSYIGGWTKQFDTSKRERRWHAKEVKNHIEIHLDVTYGYHHKVMIFRDIEKNERKRLMDIYKQLYPQVYKPMKVEYAPNLMEIQKIKLNDIKPSLLKRILSKLIHTLSTVLQID